MFIEKKEALKFLGCRHSCLYEMRRRGEFVEGVHYVRLTPTKTVYRLEALQHFMDNRHRPDVHQAYISRFLRGLEPARA